MLFRSMSAAVDIQTKTVSGVLSVPILSVTTRIDSTKIQQSETEKAGELVVSNLETEKKEKRNESLKPEEVVFVVRESEVKLVKVKTGIQDNNFIEIIEGLTLNDEVVSAPYTAIAKELKNSTKVIVVPREELFSKSGSK